MGLLWIFVFKHSILVPTFHVHIIYFYHPFLTGRKSKINIKIGPGDEANHKHIFIILLFMHQDPR